MKQNAHYHVTEGGEGGMKRGRGGNTMELFMEEGGIYKILDNAQNMVWGRRGLKTFTVQCTVCTKKPGFEPGNFDICAHRRLSHYSVSLSRLVYKHYSVYNCTVQ